MKLLISTAKRINECTNHKYSNEAEKIALEGPKSSKSEDLKTVCIATLILIAVTERPVAITAYENFVKALKMIMENHDENCDSDEDLANEYMNAFKTVGGMIEAIVAVKWDLLKDNAEQLNDDTDFYYLSVIMATYHLLNRQDTAFQNAYKYTTEAIHSCLRFERWSGRLSFTAVEAVKSLWEIWPSENLLFQSSSFFKKLQSDVPLLNCLSHYNNQFYWEVFHRLNVASRYHAGINELPPESPPVLEDRLLLNRKQKTWFCRMQQFLDEMGSVGDLPRKCDELLLMVDAIRTQTFDDESFRALLLSLYQLVREGWRMLDKAEALRTKKSEENVMNEIFAISEKLATSFETIMNMQFKTTGDVDVQSYKTVFRTFYLRFTFKTAQDRKSRVECCKAQNELITNIFKQPVDLNFANLFISTTYAEIVNSMKIEETAKLQMLSGIFPDLKSKQLDRGCELFLMLLRSIIHKIRNPSHCKEMNWNGIADCIRRRMKAELVDSAMKTFQEETLSELANHKLPCMVGMLDFIETEEMTDAQCQFLIEFTEKFEKQAEISCLESDKWNHQSPIRGCQFPKHFESYLKSLIRVMVKKSTFGSRVDKQGYVNFLELILLNHQKKHNTLIDYKDRFDEIVESTKCGEVDSYAYYRTMIELLENDDHEESDSARYRSILKSRFFESYVSPNVKLNVELRNLVCCLVRKFNTFDPFFRDSLYTSNHSLHARFIRFCEYIDFTDEISEMNVNIYEDISQLFEKLANQNLAILKEETENTSRREEELKLFKVAADRIALTFRRIFKMAKSLETGNRRHNRYYSSIILCQSCLKAKEVLSYCYTEVLLFHLEDAIRTASRLPSSFPGRFKCLDISRAAIQQWSGSEDLEPLKNALRMTFRAWADQNSWTHLEEYKDIREFYVIPTFDNVQREPYWFVTEEDPSDYRRYVEPTDYLLKYCRFKNILGKEDYDDEVNALLTGSMSTAMNRDGSTSGKRRVADSTDGPSAAKRAH